LKHRIDTNDIPNGRPLVSGKSAFCECVHIQRRIDFAVPSFAGYFIAMRFIGNVIEKLQRHPKRVVFPEGTEPRILQAARQFHALQLGAPIVLASRRK